MEVAEARWRPTLGVTLFLTWALGTMMWGGAAYLLRDWRWLQLAVSLPCFLFLPALWLVLCNVIQTVCKVEVILIVIELIS